MRRRRRALPRLVGTLALADGEGELGIELCRSGRRTLGVAVHQDGRVIATAPERAPQGEVERQLRAWLPWIRARLAAFAAAPPLTPPPGYASGERHLFLGAPLPLRVVVGTRAAVGLEAGELVVAVPDPSSAPAVARALSAWFRRRAAVVLAERFEAGWERVKEWHLPRPDLAVRTMRSRWGSCSPRGRITLNAELVKLPLELVDYVVLHELCHLRAPHHRPSFWRLLGTLLPDWRERRARLRQLQP